MSALGPADCCWASASLRQRSQTIRPSTSAECFSQAGLRHTSHSRYSQVSRSLESTFQVGWSFRLHPSTLHFTKDMDFPPVQWVDAALVPLATVRPGDAL